MPWQEVTQVGLREEFVRLAMQAGSNRRELCRRFKISPQTAYKWLRRYKQAGLQGLANRSRRPLHSPRRTDDATEQAIVGLRKESNNCWGGRQLARQLADQGGAAVAPSTVTSILHRAGLIDPARSAAATPYQRFERAGPNELWQMDFKGHFAMVGSGRCHPLTILDDHSRFMVALVACANETEVATRAAVTASFRHCGLPGGMLMDNGGPWGGGQFRWTAFALWLVRLGIRVMHGRPYHPQTQGKDERFHRTLKFELLSHRTFTDLVHCQNEFDHFRDRYNVIRPHDALGLDTPARRYHHSPIPFPDTLPPIEYPPGIEVRKVQAEGWLSYHGREFRVSHALRGFQVALRPVPDADSQREVLFCHQVVAVIDLNHTDASG
jgi:transposase InsO family protein